MVGVFNWMGKDGHSGLVMSCQFFDRLLLRAIVHSIGARLPNSIHGRLPSFHFRAHVKGTDTRPRASSYPLRPYHSSLPYTYTTTISTRHCRKHNCFGQSSAKLHGRTSHAAVA